MTFGITPATGVTVDPAGVTPKFNIEDADGITYIIKLDPAEYPELASGAEVVATNLFWAAGYNTPENYTYDLDPSELLLDEELEAVFFDEDSLPVEHGVGADDEDVDVRLVAVTIMATSNDRQLIEKAWQVAIRDHDPRIAGLAERLRTRRDGARR